MSERIKKMHFDHEDGTRSREARKRSVEFRKTRTRKMQERRVSSALFERRMLNGR